MLKEKSKALILVMIGFMVVLLELNINLDTVLYPAYKTASSINTEFQFYTLQTFFGAKVVDLDQIVYTGFRFSLFPDFIGYIIIIIGSKKLIERSKVFSLSIAMAYGAIIMSFIMQLLPFMLNGERLCYIALILGVANFGFQTAVSYTFVWAICQILAGVAYRSDRRAIALTWFGTIALQIILFVTTWVQLSVVTMMYNAILFWVTVLLLYLVYRLRFYIAGEIELKKIKF